MSNLSDFLGGSGGGGDPQATFQASANVANGDLVVLNDNGTVAPVTSTNYPADFTITDSGTKMIANGSPNSATTGKWGIHNPTLGRYLFCARENGGNIYHKPYVATYNDTTNQYTFTARTTFSGYAGMMARKFSPSNGVLYGWVDANSYFKVRGFYWDGGTYSLTSDRTMESGGMSTNSAYVNPNGEGSSNWGCAGLDSSGYLVTAHGTWDGSVSTPTTSNNMSQRRFTETANIYANSLTGSHVSGSVHVFAFIKSSGYLAFVAAKIEAGSTTYGTITETSIQPQSSYKSQEYDTDSNMGIVTYYQGSTTNALAFSVDASSLDVTVYQTISTTATGSSSSVGYNPVAKKFMICDSTTSDVEIFTVASDGTQGTVTTHDFHPNAGAEAYVENACIFPRRNTGNMAIIFNSGTNPPSSSYIDTANHMYVTQFGVPYVDTNIDSHFGEAKEAITSGNAGPVGILNRTVDVTGASFQKGQKLFANPSGSALATSGTYRVGYATDGDTILVTGDAS